MIAFDGQDDDRLGASVIASSESDHGLRAGPVIGRRRKGSSRGRRNCCSSWANTRATLTARSLARWPESHREQARGAFAEPPGAS